MKTILMAGGRGTRIAELFPNIPKPLIPVAGMPILEREIRSLCAQGFKDIILTVGYLADKIISYFGDGSQFGAKIDYFVEESPLGNAGALFRLKRKIYAAQIDRLMQIDAEMGTVLADHLQGSLPAISLVGEPSLTTAFMNDAVPVLIFAQQVNGLGRAGDVFLGISTSGNSKNVLYAAVAAKSKGLKVIGLTGQNENRLETFADVCIHVPETETYKIQELHLPVYHCLCLML